MEVNNKTSGSASWHPWSYSCFISWISFSCILLGQSCLFPLEHLFSLFITWKKCFCINTDFHSALFQYEHCYHWKWTANVQPLSTSYVLILILQSIIQVSVKKNKNKTQSHSVLKVCHNDNWQFNVRLQINVRLLSTPDLYSTVSSFRFVGTDANIRECNYTHLFVFWRAWTTQLHCLNWTLRTTCIMVQCCCIPKHKRHLFLWKKCHCTTKRVNKLFHHLNNKKEVTKTVKVAGAADALTHYYFHLNKEQIFFKGWFWCIKTEQVISVQLTSHHMYNNIL